MPLDGHPPTKTIAKSTTRQRSRQAAPGSLQALARATYEPKATFVLDLGDGRPPRTVAVQYPKERPDEALHERMAAEATVVFCSSCSTVEAQPHIHRCHGADVCAFLRKRYDAKLEARGMQGIGNDEELCALCDAPGAVHVSRSLARGTATEARGVKSVLHQSRYGNPFIISKGGFTLGESLALFHYYVHYADFRKLEPYLIKLVCRAAFVLSDDPVSLAIEMEENTAMTIEARYRKLRTDLLKEWTRDVSKLSTEELKVLLAHVEQLLGPAACAEAYRTIPALA